MCLGCSVNCELPSTCSLEFRYFPKRLRFSYLCQCQWRWISIGQVSSCPNMWLISCEVEAKNTQQRRRLCHECWHYFTFCHVSVPHQNLLKLYWRPTYSLPSLRNSKKNRWGSGKQFRQKRGWERKITKKSWEIDWRHVDVKWIRERLAWVEAC